jgi:CRISPR/Cas system CSM-associated protein Csm2 small subunit
MSKPIGTNAKYLKNGFNNKGYHSLSDASLDLKEEIYKLIAKRSQTVDICQEIEETYLFKLDPAEVLRMQRTPISKSKIKAYKDIFDKSMEHIELAQKHNRVYEYNELYRICKEEIDKLRKDKVFESRVERFDVIEKEVVGLDGQKKLQKTFSEP